MEGMSSSTQSRPAPPAIIIETGRSNGLSLRELWSYRELFSFLVWRDILVRYKQAVLGISWVAIRPLLTMLVFSILFGRIAGLSSGGAPYPVLVFAGLIPWQFFADSLTFGAGSFIGNTAMISKVYFPRLLIPASPVVCGLLDLGVSSALLFALMFYYQFTPTSSLVYLPFFIVWLFIFSLALTVGLAALTVRYRDFKYITAFMVQIGTYVSPVGFSVNVIPEKWRLLYAFNPMVGIIGGFRWAFLGENIDSGILAVSGVFTFLICVAAFVCFKNMQDTFADVI